MDEDGEQNEDFAEDSDDQPEEEVVAKGKAQKGRARS